jgi:hypothetical protein
VFTREIDKGLTGLVKEVESALKDKKNTTAFLVLQEKDQKAASDKLNKLAAETKATFPLTVAEDGDKSPSGYDLDPKVKHTVLVYKNKKVVNNFALNEITEGDLKAIVEAAKKNMEPGKGG